MADNRALNKLNKLINSAEETIRLYDLKKLYALMLLHNGKVESIREVRSNVYELHIHSSHPNFSHPYKMYLRPKGY